MTTTKTKTRETKAINITPAKKVGKVQDGTKVHALIEALSKPGGATLQQCAKALSFKGAQVDEPMAIQWIKQDLCKLKGYGISQKGTKLTLRTPKTTRKKAA